MRRVFRRGARLIRRREVKVVECKCAYLLEQARISLPIFEIGFRNIDLRYARASLPQEDEPIGFRIWQRGENNSLYHTKHGAVRSDAERERQQGNEREAGIAGQRTETVTEILDKGRPFERFRGGETVQPFLRHHIVPFDAKESNLDDSVMSICAVVEPEYCGLQSQSAGSATYLRRAITRLVDC